MRKIIALYMCVLVLFSLAACGRSTSSVPFSIPCDVTEADDANNTLHVSSDISNNENNTNTPASNNEANISDDRAVGTDAISFEYLYRGFTAVMLDDTNARASFDDVAGDRVILTEDDWHNYMEKYCPGIAYYNDVDFTSECLIAITSTNAKPTYAISSPIRAVTTDNGSLRIEYNNDPSTYIYALNTDTVTHFSLSVLIVSKSDLLENIADDWVYTA